MAGFHGGGKVITPEIVEDDQGNVVAINVETTDASDGKVVETRTIEVPPAPETEDPIPPPPIQPTPPPTPSLPPPPDMRNEVYVYEPGKIVDREQGVPKIATPVNGGSQQIISILKEAMEVFTPKIAFAHFLRVLGGLTPSFIRAGRTAVIEGTKEFSYDMFKDAIRREYVILDVFKSVVEQESVQAEGAPDIGQFIQASNNAIGISGAVRTEPNNQTGSRNIELDEGSADEAREIIESGGGGLSGILPDKSGLETLTSLEGLSEVLNFINDTFLVVSFISDNGSSLETLRDFAIELAGGSADLQRFREEFVVEDRIEIKPEEQQTTSSPGATPALTNTQTPTYDNSAEIAAAQEALMNQLKGQ